MYAPVASSLLFFLFLLGFCLHRTRAWAPASRRISSLDVLFAAAAARSDSSTSISSESKTSTPPPQNSRLRTHLVSLEKPMGLVLEEEEEDGSSTTKIIDMVPGGNAARASQRGDADVCIGDKILAVDDNDDLSTLEQVMEAIAECRAPMVRLTLQRPAGTVSVRFDNGVAIAARPGTHLCNLAMDAGVDIEYSCRNGACGTCEQLLMVDGEQTGSSSSNSVSSSSTRYVRPCVATVPSDGATHIRIVPSDRFAP